MDGRRLHLTTTSDDEKQKILLVCKEEDRYVRMLKAKLEQYDNDVIVSHQLPHQLKPFTLCIFFDVTERVFRDLIGRHANRLVFVFLNRPDVAERCVPLIKNMKSDTVKIISLETAFESFEKDLDTIFWFSFSKTPEKYLPIVNRNRDHTRQVKPTIHHVKKGHSLKSVIVHFMKPKYTVSLILLTVLVIHLLFIPFLLAATYFHYRAITALRTNDRAAIQRHLSVAGLVQGAGQGLYTVVRPSLSLFSLAMVPDDLFLINTSLHSITEETVELTARAEELRPLIQSPDKSQGEVDYTATLKDSLVQKILKINQNLSVLESKLPEWNQSLVETKRDIQKVNNSVNSIEGFFPYLDWLFGKDKERKYLILFANNMELRPGGGFIGSFAIVTLKGFSLNTLHVYDVYDADGQLTEHVKPPTPIKDYLDQPHWFLRDSAFSPDFQENAQQAVFFLDRTMKENTFDGVILITTSAIQNLMGALDELYVPDFKERVNADNFYIKAQLYAEKEFFPGSRQKKTFLASVMNQMLLELPEASPMKLFDSLKRSLDEKQIVMFINNREVQDLIDTKYWAGRTILPTCQNNPSPNCLADYVFPYDANLGVNKANFYITKSQTLDVQIDKDGTVRHTLTIQYKNNSFENVFPGGRYKNYFQVLLPKDIQINRIMNMGKVVQSYDLQSSTYTKIGFLSQIPPQTSGQIKVEYSLKGKVKRGNGIYQLILQKQIGSPNSDTKITIALPKNLYVVNKNFSPIVKDNKIFYNTSLSADKIFFIEFFFE